MIIIVFFNFIKTFLLTATKSTGNLLLEAGFGAGRSEKPQRGEADYQQAPESSLFYDLLH